MTTLQQKQGGNERQEGNPTAETGGKRKTRRLVYPTAETSKTKKDKKVTLLKKYGGK